VIVIRLRFNLRGNGLGPGFFPLRLRVSVTIARDWVTSATARLLHYKEWTVTGMPDPTQRSARRNLECPVNAKTGNITWLAILYSHAALIVN
jgi:hypothetical protein